MDILGSNIKTAHRQIRHSRVAEITKTAAENTGATPASADSCEGNEKCLSPPTGDHEADYASGDGCDECD